MVALEHAIVSPSHPEFLEITKQLIETYTRNPQQTLDSRKFLGTLQDGRHCIYKEGTQSSNIQTSGLELNSYKYEVIATNDNNSMRQNLDNVNMIVNRLGKK